MLSLERVLCLSGKNLFHRAIVESGSALSSWAVAASPLRYARRLAAAVNCTSTSTTASEQSADYIRCFKSLLAETLVNIESPTSTTTSGQSADYIRCFKSLPAETLANTEVKQFADYIRCFKSLPAETLVNTESPTSTITSGQSADYIRCFKSLLAETLVNAEVEQSADYIRCFKSLPAETLVDADVPGVPNRYLSALGPTVDRRTVLPSAVRSLTRRRNVESVFGRTPLLLGVTRDEGQIFLAQSDLDEVGTTTTVFLSLFIHSFDVVVTSY